MYCTCTVMYCTCICMYVTKTLKLMYIVHVHDVYMKVQCELFVVFLCIVNWLYKICNFLNQIYINVHVLLIDK